MRTTILPYRSQTLSRDWRKVGEKCAGEMEIAAKGAQSVVGRTVNVVSSTMVF